MASDESDEVVVTGSEESGAGGEEDESEEQLVSYENVPTWEEAISYLLHPNQVQVESGSGQGNANAPARGGAPGDHPRQTRHIGHRKGRR